MEYHPELEDYVPDASLVIAMMATKNSPASMADLLEHMIVSGKYRGYAMCLLLTQHRSDETTVKALHIGTANFLRKYLEIKYPRAKRNLTLDAILKIEFPQDAWLYNRPTGISFNAPRKDIFEAPFECRIACSNWYWALIRELRAMHAHQA